MATTTDRPRSRRGVLAGGLAMAACLACCLLPVAVAGGLLGRQVSGVAGALLPAVVLGLVAAGAAGAWWWRRRTRSTAAPSSCDCRDCHHP